MSRQHELTLRFLAAPTNVGYSGNVDAGVVLEWIDKAGYALAVGWCSGYAVTAYVGNVHFTNPVRSGDLVEVRAHMVHTGRSSMHMQVTVDTLDPRSSSRARATSCLVIFVAVDADGTPAAVPTFQASTPDERRAEESAIARIALRADIETAMSAQRYSDAGTAPRTVLRFLAAPTDVNWGGKVHGGFVMRWIDEAAHVIASQWCGSTRNVAFYTGGVRFYRPMFIGQLVEVEARLLHTGRTSMHIGVHVRAADPVDLRFQLTTHCLVMFVRLDDVGRPVPVPSWVPASDEDRALDAHAFDLVRMRAAIEDQRLIGTGEQP